MPQPTSELTQAINHLHAAITAESDPKVVRILSECLAKMTQAQEQVMGGAPMSDYSANEGGGGSPPQGPQTAADPQLAALLSGLGGGGGP